MIDDRRIQIEQWLAEEVAIAQTNLDSVILNPKAPAQHILAAAKALDKATNRLLDYVMIDKLPDNLPAKLQNVS